MFYILYAEDLAPRLHSVYTKSMETGTLPSSMGEAVIVVILKPEMIPSICCSYRPISLLNVDAKLLAKILANRPSTVITELVHSDQTGFMLVRGTDINI